MKASSFLRFLQAKEEEARRERPRQRHAYRPDCSVRRQRRAAKFLLVLEFVCGDIAQASAVAVERCGKHACLGLVDSLHGRCHLTGGDPRFGKLTFLFFSAAAAAAAAGV